MNRLVFLFLLLVSQAASSQVKLQNLRCEYRTNPAGIETPTPRLSWELLSSHHNILQSAWRILVSDDTVSLLKNIATVWDSRQQFSDVSIGVHYTGIPLSPGRTYYWKVMVWDNHQDSSHWSPIAAWQMGLFTSADWKGARWIGYEELPDSGKMIPAASVKGVKRNGPFRDTLPLFRKDFTVDKPLKRATVFICGLGHFEMSLNGNKTGDHFLDPGWTTYDKKALYVPFDVTSQLQQGLNTIGVMLGNGFYYIPRERYHKLLTAYGYPKLIARIFLEYNDGTTGDIVSDPSWATAPGPLLFSSIYGGEDYDARREQSGWDSPHFEGKGWRSSVIVAGPPELHAQSADPLKVFENFTARRVIRTGTGAWIYDLGQNASGIARLQIKGTKGATVRITPAELLNADSTANQKATGKPYYWEYTLKGGERETWQPRFTYYGFRYLQMEGAVPEGAPNPDGLPVVGALTGLHTRNSMERAGKFVCSNSLFNRTDSLIDWAIQSNMASVFTDCPHREKLGWLEEAHLMGNSLRYNYAIAPLYRKIIHDMMDAQTGDGLIPEIAPEFVQFGEPFRDSPEWGSSGILVPWYLYCWYGDKETLGESYPMMQRYIAYLSRQAKDHILYEGLGDWYDLGPAHPGVSQLTPKGVTATAIYYYDLSILEKIARLLGKPDEGQQYRQLADSVKTAFNSTFFDRRTGQVASGSQAANAMALYMGLAPEGYRDSIMNNIVRDLRGRNNSLTAGDIGFRYLLKVLDEEGRADLIFDMNSRTDVPGYGYQLAHGATALTESWQALPSVSNNHFMLGHIMEWLYDGLAGITTTDSSIAFHHIVIRPERVGDVRWVQADYHSPYGMITSDWKRGDKTFDLDLSIPANTTATVYLPAAAADVITEGWKGLPERKDIRLVKRDDKVAVLEIGSGNFNFRVQGGNTVSQKKMAEVYEEVKTPYKYGLVMAPPDKSKKMDCPTVFHKGEDWFMTYIIYDGRGYETWLAKSRDLLHWNSLGRILSFTDTTSADSARWDANQKAGYNSLEDMQWGGSYRLQPYKGKYWMSYFGGNTKGYEAGILSEGIAYTDKDPSTVHEWQRLDRPVLTVKDTDVAWWDNHTMYKSWVIWDKPAITGHPFVMYYNANGDSVNKKRGSERIGMAVSDDMIHWKRPRRDPVLDHLTGITGDPYIQKIGDLYVMFYFGAFWRGKGGAFNRFACSYDLVHWTDWTGPDLIESSEPYDEVFAHKSFVVKYKGTVYHFYCAVDKNGNRGIALATSTDKREREVSPTDKGKSEAPAQPQSSLHRRNFDAGWKFFLGDDSAAKAPDYNDAGWRTVDLPHDWSIEGAFNEHNSTGQQEGGLPAGIGWYRKRFRVPEYAHVYIDFDGVYRNSEVWINGHYLGKRPNGYISFRYDLDKWIDRKGDNIIAVRVDNSQQTNSRWYSGSGIYRHVWLETAGPTAVDRAGTFITSVVMPDRKAYVRVSATFRTTFVADYTYGLQTILYDATGKKVDSLFQVAGFGDSLRTLYQELSVPLPHCWSPDHPYLYKVEIRLTDGANVIDRYTVRTGIRDFRFDREKGFVLNGRPTKIRGVCLHHDLGALGAAVNTRAIQRQLQILKEMGCNAIRTSHNPPAPELLDLCDEMGFIVMDEAFDMWRKKKTRNDYSLDFPVWHRQDLEDQVRRDRNHPSVFIWSIGNEIREQFDSSGIALARELAGIVKSLDSTRPVTSALTELDTAKNFIYRSDALDLIGLNYHQQTYPDFLQRYPGKTFIATETTSALETRGHYDMPSDSIRRWPPAAKQPLTGANPDWTVSAYDNVSAYWGSTHEETWKVIKKYPFLSGLFVWTGFDYIGEPTPYPWPARSSYFGIVDLAGFPKDVYYMYQSEWTSKPVLHIFPHWNWNKGQVIDVWAYYSQADEVELFLNGRSLGTRKKTGDDLHVRWRVAWQPGILKAVSRKNGKIVLVRTLRTAGPAAKIQLQADRKIIRADGSDLSFITVRIVDANGQIVPDAVSDLHFAVTGQGVLAGLDNGYQADLESFHTNHHTAYNGLCLAIVRSKKSAGKAVIHVSGEGLMPAYLTVISN